MFVVWSFTSLDITYTLENRWPNMSPQLNMHHFEGDAAEFVNHFWLIHKLPVALVIITVKFLFSMSLSQVNLHSCLTCDFLLSSLPLVFSHLMGTKGSPMFVFFTTQHKVFDRCKKKCSHHTASDSNSHTIFSHYWIATYMLTTFTVLTMPPPPSSCLHSPLNCSDLDSSAFAFASTTERPKLVSQNGWGLMMCRHVASTLCTGVIDTENESFVRNRGGLRCTLGGWSALCRSTLITLSVRDRQKEHRGRAQGWEWKCWEMCQEKRLDVTIEMNFSHIVILRLHWISMNENPPSCFSSHSAQGWFKKLWLISFLWRQTWSSECAHLSVTAFSPAF